MIIRIQANGGSFRGAGLYYLHDKADDPTLENVLKPKTDERVWFTDTRNCLSMDPGRAFEEMWLTAEDQAYLKMQAGVKRCGRVCEDAVKTLSMSWHKDDHPTPEHMVEAADALMKHMGWDAHQAVYVGHNDTEHRHIHVVLNRVHPETGRTLDDYREQKRAQTWALEYERSQDRVRCEQREERARRRQPEQKYDRSNSAVVQGEPAQTKQPANDHLPHNVIMLTRPYQREFQTYEVLRAEQDLIEQTALLKTEQRDERQQFFKDGALLFKATRHAVYDEVRTEYRPQWAALYKEAQEVEQSAEVASDTALARAFHFAKSGQWEKAREAFGDRDSVRDAVAEDFKLRFSELKDRQMEDMRERQRDACDELRLVRDVEYKELLHRQRLERATLQSGLPLNVLDTEHRPPATPANQNVEQAPVRDDVQHQSAHHAQSPPETDPVRPIADAAFVAAIEHSLSALSSEKGTKVDVPELPLPDTGGTNKQVTDLVAGGIGGTASYLADQLGELFAPTPPEVREAQAKAATQQASEREAQKPEHDDKAAAYARMIDSAVRRAEAERAQKDDTYWKDRDRDKGWERDQ